MISVRQIGQKVWGISIFSKKEPKFSKRICGNHLFHSVLNRNSGDCGRIWNVHNKFGDYFGNLIQLTSLSYHLNLLLFIRSIRGSIVLSYFLHQVNYYIVAFIAGVSKGRERNCERMLTPDVLLRSPTS